MKGFLLALIIPIGGFAQSDQWKNVYTQSAWTERDTWQKPAELIRKMNIREGSVVADIGCHEGYFSFKLSAKVGSSGKVYAVDVEQAKLDKLTAHIQTARISNIIPVKGDYDDPKLPPLALDAVIILDTYHEMDDHDMILQRVKNSLKRGGRLVLCEPIAASRRDLPRADQEKKHELGLKYALEDLAKAGFRILEKSDPFVDREKVKGDKMWMVVATPE